MSNGNVFQGLDLREDILEYLLTLLGGISGVATVWRNRGNLPEADPQTRATNRPALILLDGDQRLGQATTIVAAHKTVKMPPSHAVMSPEIYIVLDKADDRTNTTLNGAPYNVGQQLSFWHWMVKGAIENDPGLLGLLTANGQIIWTGFETDFRTGRSIGADGPQGCVRYDFYHPINPPRS